MKTKQRELLRMKANLHSLRSDMRLNSLYMVIREKARLGMLEEIKLPEVSDASKRSNNGR